MPGMLQAVVIPFLRIRVFVLLLALGLAACAMEENEVAIQDDMSAEEIFAKGQGQFGSDPLTAATTFAELERIHPYSPLVKQAIIRGAEAYYRGGNFEEAVIASKHFLELYPGDALAPLAQFLIALSQYDQIPDVRRDQSFTRDARQELLTFLRRYPDSVYAQDARLMLEVTEHQLAGKEMVVGRYYLENGDYIAAGQRFRNVVQNYSHTGHAAEALYRLVEVNLSLGLIAEARRAAAILGHNFLGSSWYQDAYNLLREDDERLLAIPGTDSEYWPDIGL